MQASADSLEFAPPAEPAAFRGFALAIIAHVLLLIALTWGINWQSDDRNAAVEAELWSAIPREAAPPPAPQPKPQPQPQPQPQPEVKPPPVVQPAPPPPVVKQPDINVEREKKRREEEAKRREEEELRKQQLETQKREAQKREQDAQKRKLEEQQRLAEEKKQKEELAKKEKQKQEVDAKKREQLRKDTIAKMMAEATGNGSPNARGTEARSSGPSDSYAGRIRARVKPNIVFADDVPGNPSAEVEVRMAPDGTIVSRHITKPSGVQAWDEAVLRALDKTEVLPRDIDGRVHTPLIIVFTPRS
jgi:colicin import membrane protein